MVIPKIHVDELQNPISSTFIFQESNLNLTNVPGWSFVDRN